jgi:hypothetical protein
MQYRKERRAEYEGSLGLNQKEKFGKGGMGIWCEINIRNRIRRLRVRLRVRVRLGVVVKIDEIIEEIEIWSLKGQQGTNSV